MTPLMHLLAAGRLGDAQRLLENCDCNVNAVVSMLSAYHSPSRKHPGSTWTHNHCERCVDDTGLYVRSETNGASHSSDTSPVTPVQSAVTPAVTPVCHVSYRPAGDGCPSPGSDSAPHGGPRSQRGGLQHSRGAGPGGHPAGQGKLTGRAGGSAERSAPAHVSKCLMYAWCKCLMHSWCVHSPGTRAAQSISSGCALYTCLLC